MLPAYFYIFTYATPQDWLLYALGTLAALVSGMAFPILDLLYGYWLQAQAVPNPESSHITYVARWTALACLGVGVAQGISCFLFLSCFNIVSTRLAARLRHAYVQSILYQDATFFETVGAGEAATRIVKDIGTVKTAAGDKLGFVIWGLSTLVTAVVIAFIKAPRLAGVLTAIIPVGGILFTLVTIPGESISARIVDGDGKANTFLEQILSSIRVVQAFAAENVLVAKYDEHLKGLQKDGTKRAIVRGSEMAVSYFTLYLVYTTAIWWGSQQVTERGLPVAAFFTCFWNFFNALYAIATIQPHVAVLIDSVSTQHHLREVINRQPVIDVRAPTGLKFDDEDWDTTIELKNVSFAYPSRPEAKVLDDISVRIEQGKVTAIVGASGSGKSTIAGLLLRWWDLQEDEGSASPDEKKQLSNQLSIGGHDIKEYNLGWLRSQIAIVRQDPQLFSTTIFENVIRGLSADQIAAGENGSDERRALVRDALEKAQAWSFVNALPQGMDTKVSGAKTSNLSGGQRQRIAAARALIRQPKILVLDEGTSALDSEVEKRLMGAVHAEQKEHGMTTILIAHRLSTIQSADSIIVMDKGRVVEQGRYEELIQMQGVFASLVAHQANPSGTPPPNTKNNSSQSSLDEGEKPHDQIAMTVPKRKMDVSEDPGSSVSANALEKGSNKEPTRPLDEPRLGQWGPSYLGYLGEQWRWLVGGSLAAIGIGATFPIAAWLIGLVATTFSIQGDGPRLRKEAYRWSEIYLFIAIAVLVCCWASAFLLEAGAERVSRRLRVSSLRAIVRQEVGFFDKESTAAGSLTATVSTYGGSASVILGLIWMELLASLVNLVGAVALGFSLSWKVSVVSFIPLPFAGLAAYLNVVVLARYEEQQRKPLESASAYVSENVDNIQTVAALGLEGQVLQRFKDESQQSAPPKRQLYLGSIGFGVGVSFVLIVSSIVMAWGTSRYARREITLAQLTSSLEAIVLAGFSATRVFSFVPDLARAVQAFKRIIAWELREPQMAHLPASKDYTGPTHVRGEVRFKNCSMTYEGQHRPAVENISLHIKAGQTIAFCGPSGGGKSTVLALINRFYDPSMGSIEVDGIDIRSIPLSDYRSALALVSQDAVLYDGTFRENITLGIGREVTDEELTDICTQANILDFILSLPDGFDTNVGLKGTKMSGGQRQRVCIARALLRNPKILLLDEATSALDAESEKYIQEALDIASQGRTTICVAHRLSTIRNADVIYVVEDGQVVESGSHTELLQRHGRYFDLVEMQL